MLKSIREVGLILIAVSMGIIGPVNAQNSVASLFASDYSIADKYYQDRDYKNALRLYVACARKKQASSSIYLRIARCYYHLKEYKKAIENYETSLEAGDLPKADLLNYAEANAAILNYKTATALYKKYLQVDPDNELVVRKIWRLDNMQYLFEDSAHYALRPVPLNTTSAEMCASLYGGGLVFMSNRDTLKVIKNVNGSGVGGFYELYFAEVKQDSTSVSSKLQFEKATHFGKGLTSKYNTGPVAFFDKERQVAVIASSSTPGRDRPRTLGLYFGVKKNGRWEIDRSFTHNSEQYSIYDVTIDESGKTLFFSSDRTGGFGGKDLYKSELKDGLWSTPLNLGDEINTPKDEAYPFLHNRHTLYFSSNGLPGLGEMDVFKSNVSPNGFDEPQNVGYPINSSKDDFGFVLDSLGTHGYISSNRKNGGYDDDLYEFDMDLQTYPLSISGTIKYKEHTWTEDTELKIMASARVSLVDNLRNVSVFETISDRNGHFSVLIPYFSKYFIRIIGVEGDEHKASLEILKYRKELSSYEIVIIKDLFAK